MLALLAFVGVVVGMGLLAAEGYAHLTGQNQSTPWATAPVHLDAKAHLPVSLPCHKWYGLLVVQADFPGHQVLNCGLDTVLNACAVPPLTVLRFQLPNPSSTVHLQRLWQTFDVPTTSIPQLNFNTLSIGPLQVAQLDVLRQLSPEIAVTAADAPSCWLGGPFLSAFQVSFSAEQGFLLLESPQAPLPKGRGIVVVPIKLRDGCPEVMVSLPKTKPFPALVDVTAPLCLLPVSAAEALKLQPLQSLPMVGPDGKPYRLAHAVVPRLSVGSATQEKIDVAFLQPPVEEMGSGGPKVPESLASQAVLGRNFLDNYRVTLNYQRGFIALAPLPKEQTTKAEK